MDHFRDPTYIRPPITPRKHPELTPHKTVQQREAIAISTKPSKPILRKKRH
jgi:hypothetical protein